ncbi:Vacuolar protein sorting-associated protein 33A [Pseudolycoriella hygida]|uniref:Vacuolar protein sorting-associated protein 33A n=1 Tax=Pseudolycoriella hygida TaxID=35572 RepID=A0A9Q0RXM5_9DIPT|nr:Vacuolar protein sorting-associated protein 33A [Pseudolycoriella hygida]
MTQQKHYQMFPHLSSWRVNLMLLQEAANKELISILDKCEGTKAIVWDDSLSGPVGLVTKYTFLKERNVIKMLPLRAGSLTDVDVKHIIFITRPILRLMDYVAENIHHEEKRKSKAKKEFHLFFVPKMSMLCEKHLKIRQVYGSFTNVGEFKCEIFPVDSDLLSMEVKDCYRELHIDGDPTCLYLAASAIISLQKLYGRIPKIYGMGLSAQRVWKLTNQMGEDESSIINSDKGAIDQLILLDRSVDLMSVLTTQLTYEGLIDEIFGINQSTAHFLSEPFTTRTDETVQAGMPSAEKKSIVLNSSEDLYTELRDKNFNAVGQILSRHAKSISTQLEERHGEISVQEMKKFVERLPLMLAAKQSLATHTTIAEMIKDVTDSYDFQDELACEQEFLLCEDLDKASSFIEDLIAKKAPLKTVIRLMCMQCIAGSGFKPKVLDYYKRELVQVYGIETLLTIGNLEKVGLLKLQTGTRSYAVLRKIMNLTVDDALEVAPKDISYVHSFYAPLSIRIIEQLLKPMGWQFLNDNFGCLPGPTFEDYQPASHEIGNRRGSLSSEISQSDQPTRILVFFLGGCTFAEIAALRFLSQQDDANVEFIIATTKILNKNTFLEMFLEGRED